MTYIITVYTNMDAGRVLAKAENRSLTRKQSTLVVYLDKVAARIAIARLFNQEGQFDRLRNPTAHAA